MKKRKFAEGGTPALDELASGKEKGSFDTDTYARAKKFLSSKTSESEEAPKKAKSAEPAPKAKASPKAEPKDEPKAKAAPVKTVDDEGERVGPTVKRAAKNAQTEAEYAEMTRPGRDAIEGVYPESLLLGGAGIRGLMGRKAAPEAAGSTSRSLATRDDPLTFLGRSGAKNITPMERLAGRQEPRLEFGAAKIGRDGDTMSRLAQGAPKPAAPRQIAGTRQAAKPEDKNLTDEVLDIVRGSSAKGRATPKGEDFGKAAKAKRASFKEDEAGIDFKRGGKVKKYAAGGAVSASRRGDGIAQRGKTKGKVC